MFNSDAQSERYVYTDVDQLTSILNNQAKARVQKPILIYSFDLNKLWRKFTQLYKVIDAAGGIIMNDKDEVLFIFRKGKWDLPKGKVDEGELIKDAAEREVKEECGIKDLQVGKLFGYTYHTYNENKRKILKRTYWYEMHSEDKTFVPQLEEDITEVTWIPKSKLQGILNKSFRSVADLIREYFSE